MTRTGNHWRTGNDTYGYPDTSISASSINQASISMALTDHMMNHSTVSSCQSLANLYTVTVDYELCSYNCLTI